VLKNALKRALIICRSQVNILEIDVEWLWNDPME